MDWVWLLVLIVGLGLGAVLTVVQLPGTWFMLVVTAVYAWGYEFQRVTWLALGAMVALALLAEGLDFIAAAAGAAKYGASRRAAVGALIGGFAGMIVFTPLVPIPIVGTMIGGVVGCFAGAFIAEMTRHGELEHSARAGFGAMLGRLAGMLVKTIAAFAIAGIALGAAIR